MHHQRNRIWHCRILMSVQNFFSQCSSSYLSILYFRQFLSRFLILLKLDVMGECNFVFAQTTSFFYRMIPIFSLILLVIGRRILRALTETNTSRAVLENISNVDGILYLIRDIYLARENEQWHLEKWLFAELMFLFRSPELLIEWSAEGLKRQKNKKHGDGDVSVYHSAVNLLSYLIGNNFADVVKRRKYYKR